MNGDRIYDLDPFSLLARSFAPTLSSYICSLPLISCSKRENREKEPFFLTRPRFSFLVHSSRAGIQQLLTPAPKWGGKKRCQRLRSVLLFHTILHYFFFSHCLFKKADLLFLRERSVFLPLKSSRDNKLTLSTKKIRLTTITLTGC